MTIVEKIVDQLKSMPQSAQAEVLGFVEYIKSEEKHISDYDEWSRFSLEPAMRDIREEPAFYRIEDLKERF
jgi:hypothetical protein